MNQILITAFVSIILFSLGIYINIKIKFAKDEKEAFDYIKNLIINIVTLLFVAWCAYDLYTELISNAPITRMSVFSIVTNSLIIYQATIINIQFSMLLRFNTKLRKLVEDIVGLIKDLSCLRKTTPGDKMATERSPKQIK